jgi:alpha-1,2-mannosyltransferase
VAVRVLLIFRVTAAMYSNLQDCDEGLSILNFMTPLLSDPFTVFNYWEPLHYLYKGYGLQTWETSPQYAIRSWAYTILWLLPSKILFWVLHETGKVRSRYYSFSKVLMHPAETSILLCARSSWDYMYHL